jgi:DNA-binding transcriptional LysR family regulator
MIDNWWSGNFSQSPLIGMEVDKADTCKEMVISGLGYGILPSVLVENRNDLSKINLKDESGKPLVRKTWMLYREESMDMKVVKEFVHFVEKLDFRQL